MTHKHPILIFIRGLPGSGKTYLAMELQKAIGEDEVVMLDPDATDYKSREYLEHVQAQTAEGVDPALHPYRFLRAQAYQGIADHKVIMWNQPFTNLEIFNKMIDRLRTHAAEHKTELPILVVEVEVDPATAKERVVRRKQAGGHGPSDATFARRVGDYTSLAAHGYNVVVVHGEDDVAASVATVMAALQELQK
jgi:thymidylate kinase